MTALRKQNHNLTHQWAPLGLAWGFAASSFAWQAVTSKPENQSDKGYIIWGYVPGKVTSHNDVSQDWLKDPESPYPFRSSVSPPSLSANGQ